MDEKNSQLIQQFKNNPALAQQLLSSADGQRLLQLLTQDGGGALQHASQQAAQGNAAEMVKMISQLMKSREGAELLGRIRRQAES